MPVAVVLGSEPHGLDPTTVNACHGKLSVSTFGQAESLNVAIAGSIVLYALSRR
jgi:TrmH family RNA methyltransferase